jgi:hypothetical protein
MEPEGSLLGSQELAIGLYLEPDGSNSHPKPSFPNIHFNIILHLSLGLPSGSFFQIFNPNNILLVVAINTAICQTQLF